MDSFDRHDKVLQTHQHPRGGKYYSPYAGKWFFWHTSKWIECSPPKNYLAKMKILPVITQNLERVDEEQLLKDTAPENSGGSCSYYETDVYSVALDTTQKVECKDVMTALQLTHDEMNIFKEVWRSAAARLGKQKEGHTALRGAHKIKFFADENLARVKRQK